MALRLLRPRGVVDLKSTPGDFSPVIALTRIVVDEIRLQGLRCGPFDKAIDLLARHPFPVVELVTEDCPLEQTARAVARAKETSKVLIRCARSRD
ncbi:MAG TPA: hypothetical protein VM492_13345 [Sumerlaeia bacterium]|nr:hypothetical protein [Sumerlaeia bacterium]